MKRVIFVDDDKLFLNSLQRSIVYMQHEWDMSFVSDTEHALKLVASGPDSVLVLDWMMPCIDGLEFAEKARQMALKQSNSLLYVILLTVKNYTAGIVQALESGVDDYVAKLTDPRELVARIRVGLRRLKSERMWVEEALLKSEETWHSVVESAPNIILIVNPDNNNTIQYINRCVPGFTIEQTIGTSIYQYMEPTHRNKVRSIIKRVFEHGEPGRYETHIQGKKGKTFWHLTEVSPVRRNKKIIGAALITTDVTECKQVEATPYERDKRFDLIVENSLDYIFQIDKHGKAIYCSPAIERVLGYTPEERLDTNFTNDVLPSDLIKVKSHFQRVLNGEAIQNMEINLLRKDGSKVPIEASVVPIFENNEVTSIYGIARDITDRKNIEDSQKKHTDQLETLVREKTEELEKYNRSLRKEFKERMRTEEIRHKLETQLRQAQKLESLGILTNDFAHDFNNMLMSILGNADRALFGLSEVSPMRANIKEIVKSSQYAAGLVQQLLVYSSNGQTAPMVINLSEIVEEMSHLLKSSVSKRAVLKTDLKSGLPAIKAHSAQLQQILVNLVTNAKESFADGETGLITISTDVTDCRPEPAVGIFLNEQQSNGKYIYIQIADTGRGMDEETKAHIFDPSFSTKFPGHGMGLAAVLGIVRDHNGAITVDSEPGKGTTIKVLFQVLSEHVEASSKTDETIEPEQWRGNGTVLLINKEESARKTVTQMLKLAGFTILTAEDVKQGVEIFGKYSDEIVCLLLEVNLPPADSNEVIGEFHKINNDVRIILSSDDNEDEAARRFADKGLSGFIHKPYTSAHLFKKLREVLESSESENTQ
ncbi:MAG: PAS domain S-box protein [Proteobacteria bacterium]|nr:PAS domain S-box protein [Pseudomonadota bacterium]